MAEDPKKKPKFKPGQTTVNQQWGIPGTMQKRAQEVDDQGGMTLAGFLTRPVRQGMNFLGDLTSGFQRNKFGSYGTGLGDTVFGVTKGYYDEKEQEAQDPRYNAKQTLWDSANAGNNNPVGQIIPAADPGAGMEGFSKIGRLIEDMKRGQTYKKTPGDRSFSDILSEAMEMLRGQGVGGGVNYDPYRDTARSQQAEADSHLARMYQGLSNSIAGDEAGIRQDYGTAIEGQKALTDETGQAIQAGYQSGNDMLTQQAQALGIQEAVANQINSGQTANNDMTRALADNAASGQTAATQLGQNQQSAVDYNTSVRQAADQEGAAQRAGRVADLQRILGQIDVSEQEANRSAQGQLQSQATSLAQWLSGNQTDERRYQDSLAMSAAEMASAERRAMLEAQGGLKPPVVNAQSTALLMEALGFPNAEEAQMWARDNPSGYASVMKLFG